MFKKDKGNNQQVTKIEPDVSVRHYPVPQPPRDWSQAMAAAAQHEEDMQNRIHALEDRVQSADVRNELVEEANKILHDELNQYKIEMKAEIEALKREHGAIVTRLTAERDKYLAQFLAMYTHLRIGGNTIVEALEAARVVVEQHEKENGSLMAEPGPEEKFIPLKHRQGTNKELDDMFGAPQRKLSPEIERELELKFMASKSKED